MIIDREIHYMTAELEQMMDRVTTIERTVADAGRTLPGVTEPELALLIKTRLPELGIRQKDLAARIGCTPAAVSMMLRGKRKMSLAMALFCLDVVGCKLAVLPQELPFTPEGDNL